MIEILILIAKAHFQIQQVAMQTVNYQNLAKEKNNFQSDVKKKYVRENRKLLRSLLRVQSTTRKLQVRERPFHVTRNHHSFLW